MLHLGHHFMSCLTSKYPIIMGQNFYKASTGDFLSICNTNQRKVVKIILVDIISHGLLLAEGP